MFSDSWWESRPHLIAIAFFRLRGRLKAIRRRLGHGLFRRYTPVPGRGIGPYPMVQLMACGHEYRAGIDAQERRSCTGTCLLISGHV